MKLRSIILARGRGSFAALLLLLTSSVVCAGQTPARAAGSDVQPTVVFLVRYAEKADVPGQDPPLSEAGRARAEALARLLQSAGVRGVYTSQYVRTRQTAEALSKRLSVEAVAVPLAAKTSNPREVSDESIRELAKRIESHAGGAVLVVGHSNSVPEVIRALGGDVIPKIDERMFDDLFVVTVYGAGRARVAHLKYGVTN